MIQTTYITTAITIITTIPILIPTPIPASNDGELVMKWVEKKVSQVPLIIDVELFCPHNEIAKIFKEMKLN